MAEVQPAHVATTGGATALVAQALVYLTHWPLQALDADTAMAFAGLLVAAGAGAVSLWKMRAPKPPAQLIPISGERAN